MALAVLSKGTHLNFFPPYLVLNNLRLIPFSAIFIHYFSNFTDEKVSSVHRYVSKLSYFLSFRLISFGFLYYYKSTAYCRQSHHHFSQFHGSILVILYLMSLRSFSKMYFKSRLRICSVIAKFLLHLDVPLPVPCNGYHRSITTGVSINAYCDCWYVQLTRYSWQFRNTRAFDLTSISFDHSYTVILESEESITFKLTLITISMGSFCVYMRQRLTRFYVMTALNGVDNRRYTDD